MTSDKAKMRKAVQVRLRRQYHRWLVRQPTFQAVRRSWIRKQWRKQKRRMRRQRRYLLPVVWAALGIGLVTVVAAIFVALGHALDLSTPIAPARVPVEWQGEFSRGLSVVCLFGVLVAMTLAARVPSRDVVTPRVLKWIYGMVTSLLIVGLLLAQIKGGAASIGYALLAFGVTVVGSMLLVGAACHLVVEFTRLGIQPVWGEATPVSGMTWKDSLFFIPALPILILICLQQRGPDWLFPLSSFSQRVVEIANGSMVALPNLLVLFAALVGLNGFFRWRHGRFSFRRGLVETTREAEMPLPVLTQAKGHDDTVGKSGTAEIDPWESAFRAELDKLRSPGLLACVLGGYWNVRFARTRSVVLISVMALFMHSLIVATEIALGLHVEGRLLWVLSAMVVMGHAIGMFSLQCFNEAPGIALETGGVTRPLSLWQRAAEKAKELPVVLGLVMLVSGLPHVMLSLRYGIDWQQVGAFLLTVGSWIITASIIRVGAVYSFNAAALYSWPVRYALTALLCVIPVAAMGVFLFELTALGMIQPEFGAQESLPWGMKDHLFRPSWLIACWAIALGLALGYCVGMYLLFHHERWLRWPRHLTE